jgi:hypothetical protein
MDVEALGFAGPDVDAEQIVMLARLWKALGLPGIELQLNSIGDAGERAAHREQLIAYFERHADVLDGDAKRRLQANPLRILDSKNPTMQAMIGEAPKLIDFIDGESRRHFDSLTRMLGDAGLAYVVNPRLVRGLDYYNRTVFEWVATSAELGAQGTVAGGGRYDYLFEMLGGKRNYACGFAIGIERMIVLLAAAGAKAQAAPLAYVVHDGADAGGARAQPRRTTARRGDEHRRQRGRRQHEVADEARRRERRAVRAHHRTGRSKHGHGGGEAASGGRRAIRGAGTRSRAAPGTNEQRVIMAVYDLEEQEQLDDLKAWWHRWGNVVTAVAVAACIAAAGVQGWRWWAAKQSEEASALFTGLSQAVRAQDLPKAKDAVAQLEDKYSRSGYSARGALVLAKMLFDSGDTAAARTQLMWVIDKSDEADSQGDRSLPPGGAAAQRQAIRRSAQDARREARRAVRGPVRGLARRRPGHGRARGGSARGVRRRARQARRQVDLQAVRSGEARRARRAERARARPDGAVRQHDGARACRAGPRPQRPRSDECRRAW